MQLTVSFAYHVLLGLSLHACRWGSITTCVRHVTRLVYLVQKHERSTGARKI